MVSAKAFAIASVALLAACASAPPEDSSRIDYSRPPPADWPQLSIEVYDVDLARMGEVCPAAYARLAGRAFAGCARLDFCNERCIVYLAIRSAGIRRSADGSGWVISSEELRSQALDHEQAHCLGYDHPGSSRAHDAWARAKARGCGAAVPAPAF